MVRDEDIAKIIVERPELKSLVFQRGFLITNCQFDINMLAFCSDWKLYAMGAFAVWLHPNTDFYTFQTDNTVYFLIGHAYNPITKAYRETEILREFASAWSRSRDATDKYLNGLTGVFLVGWVSGDELYFQPDATAMRTAYWGIVKDKLYISSHCHLVNFLDTITRDPYVDRLIGYKYYKFFGAGLPGDLSPFLELKRVQCNFEYHYSEGKMSFVRIFPSARLHTGSYGETIDEIGTILAGNMELIQQKWGTKAALSLTGGRDSTTALAAAYKQFQSLQTFSYISCQGEKPDADAADAISKQLGISHQTYLIQLSQAEEDACEAFSQIIEYNMGCIGRLKEKEIRKRVFFFYHPCFDVEIKSWVDEIGRARPYKRYRMKKFPHRVKPRYLTTMYKVFVANRALACQTNKCFKNYLDTYYQDGVFEKIPWVDLIYWEYSWPASEALHLICEHMLVFDVTIPFNNRLMLEKMLAIPLEKRIVDSIQIDVIEKLCPAINNTGIQVKDFGWTGKREMAERIYWEISHRLPY